MQFSYYMYSIMRKRLKDTLRETWFHWSGVFKGTNLTSLDYVQIQPKCCLLMNITKDHFYTYLHNDLLLTSLGLLPLTHSLKKLTLTAFLKKTWSCLFHLNQNVFWCSFRKLLVLTAAAAAAVVLPSLSSTENKLRWTSTEGYFLKTQFQLCRTLV